MPFTEIKDVSRCELQTDADEVEANEKCVLSKEQNNVTSALNQILKRLVREIFAPDGEIETVESTIDSGLFNGQSYHELLAESMSSGELFVDPHFPPDSSSLSFSRESGISDVEWLRPGDICAATGIEPCFFDDNISRFDIRQGELGDCWLLAALANLTINERLFNRVVPHGQSFQPDSYGGIFHFRFWYYGEWVDVVVDDYLPTRNGKLVFTRSSAENEFWSALIEKAYAKLYGSYEALSGGSTCDGMIDFTGGCGEQYNLKEADCPPNLFAIMEKAFERQSMNACSIRADPNVIEAKTDAGLVRGHAYSITCALTANIPYDDGSVDTINLLRLRNPWGNDVEWRGAWSDGAPEWDDMAEEELERMEIGFGHDGEFWMNFEDFRSQFDVIEMCHLAPDETEYEAESNDVTKWDLITLASSWAESDGTAGGCRNFLPTFCENPQFFVKISDPDPDDDENMATLIISLMQKGSRSGRKYGAQVCTIGFIVYLCPDSWLDDEGCTAVRGVDEEYVRNHMSVSKSKAFVNMREVSMRFRLPPACYIIIPSTYDPGENSDFILRLMGEQGCIIANQIHAG